MSVNNSNRLPGEERGSVVLGDKPPRLGMEALQLSGVERPTPSGTTELPPCGEERYDIGFGEIIRFTPSVIRTDVTTDEPVAPLLYIQGMNGDRKLEHIMLYWAQHDQRQVMGLRYYNRPSTSPKPVKPGMRGYRPGAVIPELDIQRTDDLLRMIAHLNDVDKMRVDEMLIVAESAGGPRAVLLANELVTSAKNHASSVPRVRLVLVDSAGLDDRSFLQTHVDAIKQGRNERRARKSDTIAAGMIATLPRVKAIAKQQRDRPDQRAVAYVDIGSVLAAVSESGVPVLVLSDKQDLAFRTARIRQQMEVSGAAKHVELVQTNKGGHGVGLSRVALDTVIQKTREFEETGFTTA